MSQTTGYERRIKLKSAIIIIIVIFVATTIIGMFIGSAFFWNPSKTSTIEEGDFERIQKMVKANPNNPDARVALGFQLLARNRKSEGLKEFQKAFDLSPESEKTRFGLGFAYRDTGNDQKAVEILEPLVKEYSFHFLAQCNLGLAYHNLKQYDKAIKNYQSALRIDPGAADVYLELARIYAKTGKKDEALRNVEQALKYVPDYQEALSFKASIAKQP